jgi:hypothetical protein
MGVAVGIDLAKQVHWVVARVPDGATVLNRKLDNTPTAIAELIAELDASALTHTDPRGKRSPA